MDACLLSIQTVVSKTELVGYATGGRHDRNLQPRRELTWLIAV